MATILAPNKDFTGHRFGVRFKNGKAETDDERAIRYFEGAGYTVDGKSLAAPVEPSAPAPGTLENPTGITAQPPSNDAAVMENAGGPVSDSFLPPTNAGHADPHGPLVVSPGLHAVPPAPITPGPVDVENPPAQEIVETAVAHAVLVEDQPATDAAAIADTARLGLSDAPAARAPAAAEGNGSPSKSANKPDWVAFAVSNGMTEDEANAATKADLIERFGEG